MGEEAPFSGREKIRVIKSESSTLPFGLTKTSELELHVEDELIENTQLNIHWTQHKDDPNWDEFQGHAVRDPDHPLRCCRRQEAVYEAVDGEGLWVSGGHLFAEIPGAPGSQCQLYLTHTCNQTLLKSQSSSTVDGVLSKNDQWKIYLKKFYTLFSVTFNVITQHPPVLCHHICAFLVLQV